MQQDTESDYISFAILVNYCINVTDDCLDWTCHLCNTFSDCVKLMSFGPFD